MPAERVETLVIGGGQAGLTMSHRLKQRGLPHLVLERHRIAERWRSERWDGLRFQFPNWSVRLPDFAFPHDDPEGFATTGEILTFIEAYAAFVDPPIRCGVAVTRLHRDGNGFIAETANGAIAANNVVVATGPYQRPLMPDLLRDEARLFQVHASHYSNPQQLPDGAVLVVGAGASGAQIADELSRAGRRVFLAVSEHTRMPRRYRGHDLTWWFEKLHLFDMLPEQRTSRVNPSITGAYGGRTIDFRDFADEGITLLGRVTAAREGVLEIAGGLADSLAQGDAAHAFLLDMMDEYAEKKNLGLPDDPPARAKRPDPPCVTAPIRSLDLRAENINAVIWATGYGLDFGWIDVPVFDAGGAPLHRCGVSEVPGLYFLGLQWLSRMKSAFLSYVGDDAADLADHIASRSR
ncbi:MAG: FAD-dependent oxidoreductase [Bradyrhizobium icense]|jgi:putative flavoprotein involved in K+ transport|nr:MAG: FAD-dependent oxidoreductase [Bradyrhizobium icense]